MKINAAQEFVREALAYGPLRSAVIIARGKERGFTERILFKARAAIGAHSPELGVWALPDADGLRAPAGPISRPGISGPISEPGLPDWLRPEDLPIGDEQDDEIPPPAKSSEQDLAAEVAKLRAALAKAEAARPRSIPARYAAEFERFAEACPRHVNERRWRRAVSDIEAFLRGPLVESCDLSARHLFDHDNRRFPGLAWILSGATVARVEDDGEGQVLALSDGRKFDPWQPRYLDLSAPLPPKPSFVSASAPSVQHPRHITDLSEQLRASHRGATIRPFGDAVVVDGRGVCPSPAIRELAKHAAEYAKYLRTCAVPEWNDLHAPTALEGQMRYFQQYAPNEQAKADGKAFFDKWARVAAAFAWPPERAIGGMHRGKWDGGIPLFLRGEEITVVGRTFAVSNSGRTYDSVMGYERSLW